MTVYCVGDIHGHLVQLKQAISRSPFQPDQDTIISLGDIVDGGYESSGVIEYLSSLPDCILIKGNHDCSTNDTGVTDSPGWFSGWIRNGFELPSWVCQGGYNTMASYDFDYRNVPEHHKLFIQSAYPYYVYNNMVFVHGGIKERTPLDKQDWEDMMWDRSMVYKYTRPGYTRKFPKYDRVFVGHTTAQYLRNDLKYMQPVIQNNVVAMDTGGFCNGKITVMNVDTLEYWQSNIIN